VGVDRQRHDALVVLDAHCAEAEDAANTVERQAAKSAAAMLLQSRIGERFEALVAGASAKGTWARLLTIPVGGRVVRAIDGRDVGDQIHVQHGSDRVAS
jgi:exoribonuclease-2